MTPTAREAALTRRASQGDGTYPRPQLVRERFCSLDRPAGFAHDDIRVGIDQHWERDAAPFSRTIQLPFPPESDASGIAEPDYHPCVWYRIVVTADDLNAAGHAPGRRLLLHFGAVDYEAMVWVDGCLVGTHQGGQTAFTFDVTPALAPESSEHVVVVRAFDDPFDGRMPRGKQDWMPTPHEIWYQRTTGIWRSVWLESVPPLHVARLAWSGDAAQSLVTATVELSARPWLPVDVEVALAIDGAPLASALVHVSDQLVSVALDVSSAGMGPLGLLLWSPERPTLLDAGVSVGEDVVSSYCALRQVSVDPEGLRLNGRRFYLRSVLEQGYWPASLLTPPSPQALRDEVQLILDLGFNSARIHQKVEDPRFHFWADRLGLTLWGETAAAYFFDDLALRRLTTEWLQIVRDYGSHPSIIAWVPFNESWGLTLISQDAAQQEFARGLTALTRAVDQTRPVISNDGWEHVASDLFTVHDYDFDRDRLAGRYSAEGIARLRAGAGGPMDRPVFVPGVADAHAQAPLLVTECGGVRYLPGAEDQTWGYSSASDAADFERRVRDIVESLRRSPGVAGFCWTQLTDTLQEANGLCGADRVPKLPVDVLRGILGP